MISVLTTVSVYVTDNALRLTGYPNKFSGCFTGIPTKEQLIGAIKIKAGMQRIPERLLNNILLVVRQLPEGELQPETQMELGTVTVFPEEPLFKA